MQTKYIVKYRIKNRTCFIEQEIFDSREEAQQYIDEQIARHPFVEWKIFEEKDVLLSKDPESYEYDYELRKIKSHKKLYNFILDRIFQGKVMVIDGIEYARYYNVMMQVTNVKNHKFRLYFVCSYGYPEDAIGYATALTLNWKSTFLSKLFRHSSVKFIVAESYAYLDDDVIFTDRKKYFDTNDFDKIEVGQW